jgi:pantothenate kinase-related protein Tda10
MSSITFNTIKFSEKLIAAGVPEAQAKAEDAALSEVLEVHIKDLVTKEHLDYKLAEIKADLIKWVVSLALAQTALLVGILFKLA